MNSQNSSEKSQKTAIDAVLTDPPGEKTERTTPLPRELIPSIQATKKWSPQQVQPTSATMKLDASQLEAFRPKAPMRTTKLEAPAPSPSSVAPATIAKDPTTGSNSRRVRRVLPTAIAAFAIVVLAFVLTRSAYDINHRWMTPVVLSATDSRVLQMKSYVAQESARRAELINYKNELETRLREAQRLEAAEKTFQDSFRQIVRADLAGSRTELVHLQKLVQAHEAFQLEMLRVVSAPLEAPKGAGGAQVVPQLTPLPEVQRRITSLRKHIRLLDEAAQMDSSDVAMNHAKVMADALEQSISSVQPLIATYDANLATASQSPYLVAAEGASLAFVPYQNLPEMKNDTTVYGCRFSFLGCSAVGKIEGVLNGEVTAPHPLRGEELRGLFLKISFSDPKSAELPVLYARKGMLL